MDYWSTSSRPLRRGRKSRQSNFFACNSLLKILLILGLAACIISGAIYGLIVLLRPVKTVAISIDQLNRVEFSGELILIEPDGSRTTDIIKLNKFLHMKNIGEYRGFGGFPGFVIRDQDSNITINFAFQRLADRWRSVVFTVIKENVNYVTFLQSVNLNFDLISKHYRCDKTTYLPLLLEVPKSDIHKYKGFFQINFLEFQLWSERGTLEKGFTNEPDPLSCPTKIGGGDAALSYDHKTRMEVIGKFTLWQDPIQTLEFKSTSGDLLYDLKSGNTTTYGLDIIFYDSLMSFHFGITKNNNFRDYFLEFQVRKFNDYIVTIYDLKIFPTLFPTLNHPHHRCISHKRLFQNDTTNSRVILIYDIEYLEFELESDKILTNGYSSDVIYECV